MKRGPPPNSSDTEPEILSAYSVQKLRKMTEAIDTPTKEVTQEAWEQTWHALDFDDERATIAEAETVDALSSAVKQKIADSGKLAAMQQKIQEILATKDFPTVVDPDYKGFHLPSTLSMSTVEGLIKSAAQNQVLHPVYAMRLIVEASRIIREQEGSLNEICAPEGGSVIVVGDTHGQLTDLLTIFKLVGLPSEKKIFVFNGDFVDRGPHDVSLLLILCALKSVLPKSVYFNRGNHEQRRMNERYSFEQHCRELYKSSIVYELIQRMFLDLPLATLINQKVLVLHGGLFPFDDVTIDELRRLPRGEIPKSSKVVTREHKVIQNMLWSDPRHENGWAESTRGAGILWGPDLTDTFTKKNGIDLVIRSHEMVDDGYLYWHDNKVVTLFSASNYCGKNENQGAVAIFDHNGSENIRDAIGRPFFQQYYAEVFAIGYSGPSASDIRNSCQQETLQKLRERIFQSRHKLLTAFSKFDTNTNGLISVKHWAKGMKRVLDLPVDWIVLRPYLAELDSDSKQVRYIKFLDRYKVKVDKTFWRAWEQAVIEKLCHKMMENAGSLKAAFKAMDTNGNQIIEYEEFVSVMSQFDLGLSKEQIFDLMRSLDANCDGHIDYEEFSNSFSEKWSATKDMAKNQEHVAWLKKQIEIIGEIIIKEKTSLRSYFKRADISGDRGLSYDEFADALLEHLKLTYTKDEALQLAKFVDFNNSGRISWKEFKRAFTKPATDPEQLLASVLGSIFDAIHRSKTALRTLFYQMDLDGSGKICVDEFHAGLEALNVLLKNPLTNEQIKLLHQHIDTNNDGFISYDEFLDSFSVVDTITDPKPSKSKSKKQPSP